MYVQKSLETYWKHHVLYILYILCSVHTLIDFTFGTLSRPYPYPHSTGLLDNRILYFAGKSDVEIGFSVEIRATSW